MLRRVAPLVLLLILSQHARAGLSPKSDDIIFPPVAPPMEERYQLPRIDVSYSPDGVRIEKTPKWLRETGKVFSQLLQRLLASMIANQNELAYPAPDESPGTILAQRLGSSRFKFLIQGAGNLRIANVTGPIVTSEIQGGVGLEYDIFMPNKEGKGLLVALRFTPLYAELAVINSPIATITSLPPRGFFVGSSLGVEVSERFGALEPGVRAYARSDWDENGTMLSGVSFYTAAYCRIHLKDIYVASEHRSSFVLMPMVAYYNRGNAQFDMYSWNRAQDYGDFHGNDLRSYWEALIKLEISF